MRTMTVSGRVLVRLREARGWSQTQAAEQYGTSRTHLAHIEKGDKQPGPALAKRIADVLDLSIGDLRTEKAAS